VQAPPVKAMLVAILILDLRMHREVAVAQVLWVQQV
jgi:hypothetical protein